MLLYQSLLRPDFALTLTLLVQGGGKDCPGFGLVIIAYLCTTNLQDLVFLTKFFRLPWRKSVQIKELPMAFSWRFFGELL